jgi:hypothetical protein
LAKQFNVPEKSVHVKATESRRLMESDRRLAGTWAIDYTITALASQEATISSQMTTLKAAPDNLKAEMKTQLKAAGVAQSAIDTLTVSSFSGTQVTSKVTHSGKMSIVVANTGMADLTRAMTRVLAKKLGVSENEVTVYVYAKSWIATNLPAGTTGDYGVEWSVSAPSSKDGDIQETLKMLVASPSDLNAHLKENLVKEGFASSNAVSVAWNRDELSLTVAPENVLRLLTYLTSHQYSI